MYPKTVQARNAVTPDGDGLQGVKDRKFDGLRNFEIGNMMDGPSISDLNRLKKNRTFDGLQNDQIGNMMDPQSFKSETR